MTKRQGILVGVLAAQLVLAVIIFWPRSTATGAAQPLLGLKSEDVTALTITDDQGKAVKLAKSGAAWVAPEAGDYPADATKITPVLTKLAGMVAGQAVAETAASHAQLQVADARFVRRIELQSAAGAKTTVYLGSSSGSRATHVRLAGQDQVFLARDVATWEMNADLLSWIDAQYIDVPSADITAFSLKNASGELAFQKDAAGTWSLAGLAAGEALDANTVASMVNQVASLRLTRPLGKVDDPAYGLAQPAAVVTFQAKSGDQLKTYTLTVGAKDSADNSYAAKSSESPYYVRVAEYSVQDLVEKARSGFMQATPTPAPTP